MWRLWSIIIKLTILIERKYEMKTTPNGFITFTLAVSIPVQAAVSVLERRTPEIPHQTYVCYGSSQLTKAISVTTSTGAIFAAKPSL